MFALLLPDGTVAAIRTTRKGNADRRQLRKYQPDSRIIGYILGPCGEAPATVDELKVTISQGPAIFEAPLRWGEY